MRSGHAVFLTLSFIIFQASCVSVDEDKSENEYFELRRYVKTRVEGVLGKAIDANRNGRLKHFIRDENSEAVQLFNRDSVWNKTEPNWRGEHAGKWLYAAARAAYQSGDEQLKQALFRVADYLVTQQEPDGYLGTYAPEIRMTQRSGKNIKSWDIWVHGYLIEGFLEINKYYPNPVYVTAAKKIGDLCIDTFGKDKKSLAHISYHAGMVGTGIIGPMVELYRATGDERYLEFAQYAVQEIEDRAGLELISRANKKMDVSLIGNGKIYEMMRLCVGLAKFYEEEPAEEILSACLNIWENVKEIHLSPTGGPWGGIDKHLECFNREFVFSPYGYNETCSTMDWFRFNVQLLDITGEAMFAEEMEKCAYNALLGAQFPDGQRWVYHSHGNGIRKMCGAWACCSSSGTLALEEIPPVIFQLGKKGLNVNLYVPSESEIHLWNGNKLRIRQITDYPIGDTVRIQIETDQAAYCCVKVRIPAWTVNPEVIVEGQPVNREIIPGTYYSIKRRWKEKAEIKLLFPMSWRTTKKTQEYNEQGHYLDGKTEYVAFAKGPLVYAVQSKDIIKEPSLLTLPASFDPDKALDKEIRPEAFSITFDQDTTVQLQPYYSVGERRDNIYKMTWFRLSDN